MKIRILFLFIAVNALLWSCSRDNFAPGRITGYTQGTTFSVVVDTSKGPGTDEVRSIVGKALQEIDQSLSVYNDSSVISRINRNETDRPDELFTEVFNLSSGISKMTNGSFDITVMPLVKAWGFGPDEHRNLDRKKIDSLRNLVGYTKVVIREGVIVKSDPRITMDMNAIAQGYTVDVVCRRLDGAGIENYLVEIGGEVRVKGTKDGNLWKIGIDKPADNNLTPGADLQAVVSLTDKALATSGNYRKFYIEDGVKYSHTIDPSTGYPAKNRILSASIIAGDCATADAIATACMVMGVEKSISFINDHPELFGYFIYSDDDGSFKSWMSEGIKSLISEEN